MPPSVTVSGRGPVTQASQTSRDTSLADEARHVADALARALGDCLWGVVLFGSAARGEATDASDLDILVVAGELPEKFTSRMRQVRALVPARLRSRTSLIARTRDEFERAFPSYYLDLALDGVVLAEREGYMTRQLQRLREIAQAAGLQRSRTPAGFAWRWTTRPAGHWRIDWSGVRGL